MSTRHDDGTPAWRTSSFSDQQNCVEVADNLPEVRVRDTKDRGGPQLTLPRRSWSSFVSACQAGEFNL